MKRSEVLSVVVRNLSLPTRKTFSPQNYGRVTWQTCNILQINAVAVSASAGRRQSKLSAHIFPMLLKTKRSFKAAWRLAAAEAEAYTCLTLCAESLCRFSMNLSLRMTDRTAAPESISTNSYFHFHFSTLCFRSHRF